MRTEPAAPAADTGPLLRVTGLFIVSFLVWKLFLASAIQQQGPVGVRLYPLGEVAFALTLVAVLWRMGLLRRAGFRAPLRLRSAWLGLPVLLLAGFMLAGSQNLDTSPAMVLGVALLVFGGGLGEEIIFRGTLWEGLPGLGPWARSFATALAFGGIHLGGLASDIPSTVILAQMVFAAGFGLILAGVRLSAGSIWTVVLLHIVFNFGALWAGGGVSGTFTPGVEPQLVTMGVILGLWGCVAIYLGARATGPAPPGGWARSGDSGGQRPPVEVGTTPSGVPGA